MKTPSKRYLDAIKEFPAIPLGKWPSPLETVNHPEIGKILVKRDDQSGFGRDGRSGVKARKLECMLAHVSKKGMNALFMLLGNVTNLAYDIVPIAQKAGIEIKILISDEPPLPQSVRDELFADIREHVEFCNTSIISAFYRLAGHWFRSRRKGKKTMAVLPSPAHPSAMVGAAKGFLEMIKQCEEKGEELPRAVYIASAAGTTACGFILAEAALRASGYPKIPIIPVQVVPYPLNLTIPFLLFWVWKFLHFPGLPSLDGYSLVKVKENTQYARFGSKLKETCKRVFDDYGLELDPIYGGKCWQTMESREKGGSQDESRPLVFWHCGYTPDWQEFENLPYNQNKP